MDKIAKCLHCPNHCRDTAVSVNLQLEYVADRVKCRTAELAKERPIEAEKNSQTYGDRKNPLAVRHIGKYFAFKTVSK